MIESIHQSIDEAGERLGIPTDAIDALKKINHEHKFEIRLNNGKVFQAFRVQHNNKRGPYKGGIRYHKNVTLEEIQALAMLMSLKTAAVGIPMGGGKGGVAVEPREISESELEELSRRYVAELYHHIGPKKDIPAPDVNTDSKIIDWMVDEFGRLTGDQTNASFTGKSISRGGSLGRVDATGRGGAIALKELLKLEGVHGTSLTVAIQGFGNVGSNFGTVVEKDEPNWRLIAVSDSEAGILLHDGFSARKLQKFKEDGGRFKDYNQIGIKTISNNQLTSLDVDVLVLAGLEDSLTSKNMKQVQAKYILEMANGPITSEASDFLTSKGTIILPDIVANAGGVIVSYLEWLQNINEEHWNISRVNRRLSELMEKAVNDMYKYAKQHNLNLKQAALDMAITRLTRDSN